MEYIRYWEKNGLDLITPPGEDNPEGFDVGEILKKLTHGVVLEIGSGTGRIARHFEPGAYWGVDINPGAIFKAQKALPDHTFEYVDLDEDLPHADTALFYTVALHIPDDMIKAQLLRACSAAPRVVIAEIMNPKYRSIEAGYSISNQRTIEEYSKIMSGLGFSLTQKIEKPYNYYKGENITFAVFEKVEYVNNT